MAGSRWKGKGGSGGEPGLRPPAADAGDWKTTVGGIVSKKSGGCRAGPKEAAPAGQLWNSISIDSPPVPSATPASLEGAVPANEEAIAARPSGKDAAPVWRRKGRAQAARFGEGRLRPLIPAQKPKWRANLSGGRAGGTSALGSRARQARVYYLLRGSHPASRALLFKEGEGAAQPGTFPNFLRKLGWRSNGPQARRPRGGGEGSRPLFLCPSHELGYNAPPCRRGPY